MWWQRLKNFGSQYLLNYPTDFQTLFFIWKLRLRTTIRLNDSIWHFFRLNIKFDLNYFSIIWSSRNWGFDFRGFDGSRIWNSRNWHRPALTVSMEWTKHRAELSWVPLKQYEINIRLNKIYDWRLNFTSLKVCFVSHLEIILKPSDLLSR